MPTDLCSPVMVVLTKDVARLQDHVDLFGPQKIESGDKAHVLCITDANTKFVELAVIPNKEASAVAQHLTRIK